MGAHMRTGTKGLLHRLTTRGAFLRGVVWCHSDHLTPSTLSLGFKIVPQHPPGCIGDSKGQTMISNHVGWPQIFYSNHLISIDIMPGGFVEGIFPLVSDVFMNAGNSVLCLLPSTTAWLALGKFALGMSQSLRTLPSMLRVLNDVAIAVGDKVADPHIQ